MNSADLSTIKERVYLQVMCAKGGSLHDATYLKNTHETALAVAEQAVRGVSTIRGAKAVHEASAPEEMLLMGTTVDPFEAVVGRPRMEDVGEYEVYEVSEDGSTLSEEPLDCLEKLGEAILYARTMVAREGGRYGVAVDELHLLTIDETGPTAWDGGPNATRGVAALLTWENIMVPFLSSNPRLDVRSVPTEDEDEDDFLDEDDE